MQAIGRQPQRAPDGTPVHHERHRPEQTTLYRLVQQHAATFFAQAEDAAGANLPQFVKDKFGCAVTLIQRFGSAANLNIHLHCVVLDGVYRRSAEGTPEFVEAPAPARKC